MTQAIPQHSAVTVEHYTPVEIIEAARATMGAIDLDPASTYSVNETNVKATTIFTKVDDGLSRPWHGRVWLNPPGGKVRHRSNAALWWAKLAEEYVCCRVEQAIFLGFTLEILATSQSAPRWPGDGPFCIPRKRIDFLQEKSPGVFVPGESPTHANVIAYLPPERDRVAAIRRFEEHFSTFGRCST